MDNKTVKVASRLCMTKDLGVSGNLFGGNLMAWLDEVAAIFAIQITGEDNMVTMHYSAMTFKHPVKERDIVDFYCGRIRRGSTSITFEIMGQCCGKTVFCADAVFVAIDRDGKKKKIEWDSKPLTNREENGNGQ